MMNGWRRGGATGERQRGALQRLVQRSGRGGRALARIRAWGSHRGATRRATEGWKVRWEGRDVSGHERSAAGARRWMEATVAMMRELTGRGVFVGLEARMPGASAG